MVTTFTKTYTQQGVPYSTLTDNGMVFTTRLAGGKGGRNGFEARLHRLGVRQIKSTPHHPFTDEYNHRRPHRSLPHRAIPATIYTSRPKADPATRIDTHNRVRTDRVGQAGSVTLRIHGRLHHIGVGRTHYRTRVVILAQDLNIRIINAATAELLPDFTLDPTRDYQPTGAPNGPHVT